MLNSDKAWSLNLIAKAFDATVTLDGSVKDIKTPRGMDLGFRIKARNLTKLSQLAGKTLPLNEPFKLGGTLAEPYLALDPAETATTLGKAIGGTLLFGPFGLAAALISSSSGDDNPCLTAIEVIKKEASATNNARTAKKKSSVQKSTNSISQSFKSVGNKPKKLFGK